MIKIKKRKVHDLIMYLQRMFGLHYVEFRKSANGKKVIALYDTNGINEQQKWQIEIIYGKFNAFVFVARTGDEEKAQMEEKISCVIQNYIID